MCRCGSAPSCTSGAASPGLKASCVSSFAVKLRGGRGTGGAGHEVLG
jgi:hypothetical protein